MQKNQKPKKLAGEFDPCQHFVIILRRCVLFFGQVFAHVDSAGNKNDQTFNNVCSVATDTQKRHAADDQLHQNNEDTHLF